MRPTQSHTLADISRAWRLPSPTPRVLKAFSQIRAYPMENTTVNNTAPNWKRGSACSGANCIEVARVADRFLIRDSKNPDTGTLSFTREEWEDFAEAIKRDEFRFD